MKITICFNPDVAKSDREVEITAMRCSPSIPTVNTPDLLIIFPVGSEREIIPLSDVAYFFVK